MEYTFRKIVCMVFVMSFIKKDVTVEDSHARIENRSWVKWAIQQLEAENTRSADTHIFRLEHPRVPEGVDIYLKDEAAHTTGSLKHRLARSLVLFGLCNGDIVKNTPLIEASSGSTAVSEAYFARILGLPFYAVMPATTAKEKQRLIEREGGKCVLVEDGSQIYQRAQELAQSEKGYYMDQFTNAEKATDWRGNNNIAESMFAQLSEEEFPEPDWFVIGAGTGGTSTTVARYIRLNKLNTQVCIADVENSAFTHAVEGSTIPTQLPGSRIEGIGRPRVEPSFMPQLIDRIIQIPDAASISAMRWASEVLGKKVGGSTGSNVYVAMLLADEIAKSGHKGSIVTLICDDGNRYSDTYFDDDWLKNRNLDINKHKELLEVK